MTVALKQVREMLQWLQKKILFFSRVFFHSDSLIYLLIWIKNGFNNMSTRLLKRRVGQLGPATIGRKVKSEGS